MNAASINSNECNVVPSASDSMRTQVISYTKDDAPVAAATSNTSSTGTGTAASRGASTEVSGSGRATTTGAVPSRASG
ncbi:hypothetical protein D3C81_1953520 [compost metagenome]